MGGMIMAKKTKPAETVNQALGIDDNSNQKLMWNLDEIMNTKCPKAEAFKQIAALDITNEARVYLGYMLAKRIVIIRTPTILRQMLDTVYDL
jgi:hypothetical protein